MTGQEKLTYLDKARVAGLCYRLLERERTVAVARPALDLGSRDHLVSRAVERGIQRNDLLLEGAGACDGLENRTGVVQLGYSLVLPLLLTGVYICVVILFFCQGRKQRSRLILLYDFIFIYIEKSHILSRLSYLDIRNVRRII